MRNCVWPLHYKIISYLFFIYCLKCVISKRRKRNLLFSSSYVCAMFTFRSFVSFFFHFWRRVSNRFSSEEKMERGLQGMTDAHGLCLQDFVPAGSSNGTSSDHLHNHHNLHDSVASAVSVSSSISGLMTSANNSLNHLHPDLTNQHHHHHNIGNPPTLHEPLEKLKRK